MPQLTFRPKLHCCEPNILITDMGLYPSSSHFSLKAVQLLLLLQSQTSQRGLTECIWIRWGWRILTKVHGYGGLWSKGHAFGKAREIWEQLRDAKADSPWESQHRLEPPGCIWGPSYCTCVGNYITLPQIKGRESCKTIETWIPGLCMASWIICFFITFVIYYIYICSTFILFLNLSFFLGPRSGPGLSTEIPWGWM